MRALVSGASSGIGEAFARALRARGERLVLVARRTDRLARLSAELGGADVALPLTLDLARAESAESLQRMLESRGIGVSLLVNNAGVGYAGRVHEQPPEKLRAMLDLDVRAVVELTRAFLPAMIERGRGAVLNVVSMAAFPSARATSPPSSSRSRAPPTPGSAARRRPRRRRWSRPRSPRSTGERSW